MAGKPRAKISQQDIDELRALPEWWLEKVPPRLVRSLAMGLRHFIRSHYHRGEEIADLVKALTFVYGKCAPIIGEDEAGMGLLASLVDIRLPRKRKWCCSAPTLIFQKGGIIEDLSKLPKQRRSAAAPLRDLQDKVKDLLEWLHKTALPNNPHPLPLMPEDLDDLAPLINVGDKATRLLAYYHGTTPTVMHRRLSEASVFMERMLTPLLKGNVPTHPGLRGRQREWVISLLAQTLHESRDW